MVGCRPGRKCVSCVEFVAPSLGSKCRRRKLTSNSLAMIRVESHQLLVARALQTVFPTGLGSIPSPDWLRALFAADAPAPVTSSDELRAGVRDMLRQAGYKPTGHGKPASEYLRKIAVEPGLGSINAIDRCADACSCAVVRRCSGAKAPSGSGARWLEDRSRLSAARRRPGRARESRHSR